jgi:hypothetical protein
VLLNGALLQEQTLIGYNVMPLAVRRQWTDGRTDRQTNFSSHHTFEIHRQPVKKENCIFCY